MSNRCIFRCTPISVPCGLKVNEVLYRCTCSFPVWLRLAHSLAFTICSCVGSLVSMPALGGSRLRSGMDPPTRKTFASRAMSLRATKLGYFSLSGPPGRSRSSRGGTLSAYRPSWAMSYGELKHSGSTTSPARPTAAAASSTFSRARRRFAARSCPDSSCTQAIFSGCESGDGGGGALDMLLREKMGGL